MKRTATPQYARRIEQYISITLPRPISTNSIWRAVDGRVIKSAKYRAWLLECGAEIQRQHPGRIDGAYSIRITLQEGLRLDLSNCIKSAEDILQAHGIIENDRLCRHIECGWARGVVGMHIMLISTKEGAA